MGTALGIAGIVVIFVGLAVIGVGTYLSWREDADRRKSEAALKGPAEVIKGLAALAEALSKHPVGIRLIFLGIVMIVIGGTLGGVGGLVG